MRARKLWVTVAASAIAILGLATAASSASAAESLYHPDEKSRNMYLATPTGSHGWAGTSASQGGVCLIVGVTCPSVTHSGVLHGGAPGGGADVFLKTTVGGLATLPVTMVDTWTGPSFAYNGAGGEEPDSATFSMARGAFTANLLAVGGASADYSVVVDDITDGTSFSIIDSANAADTGGNIQVPTRVTIPTVTVDPGLLTIGHSYQMRIVTRVHVPIAIVVPGSAYTYDNVVLTATKADIVDEDDDGVDDATDNCVGVSNPGQENNDGDPQGDACDPDDDNDGVPDTDETGCTGTTGSGDPLDADSDNDGTNDGADAFPCDPGESEDTDEDGVGDGTDNCVGVSNPGQENNDGDAQGDACDPDDDNDGVPDVDDPAPFDPNVPGAGSPGAGGGGVAGVVSRDKVRIKVKCPRSAARAKCKVKVVGRLAKRGPKVTNTVKRKIKRGKRKTITLTVKPQFLSEALARDRVVVLRFVKKNLGKKKAPRKYVARPIVP